MLWPSWTLSGLPLLPAQLTDPLPTVLQSFPGTYCHKDSDQYASPLNRSPVASLWCPQKAAGRSSDGRMPTVSQNSAPAVIRPATKTPDSPV